MRIRELDIEARKHGCRVVTIELLEDLQHTQLRNFQQYTLLSNAEHALFGIIEDYDGIRHARLRSRLRKIRRGLLAGIGR